MSTKAGTATFLTSVGEEKLFNLQVPEGYEGSAESETHWELPWKEEPRVNKAFKRIAALGLEKHLLDLEVYGLTVITPAQINAALGLEDGEMLDRMLSAIMRIASEDSGVEHDQKRGTHSEGVATTPGTSPTQYLLYSYLTRDPVFELMIQHPLTLPLIEYYLGQDCNLSSLTSFIKWAGHRNEGQGMGMHIDSQGATKNAEPTPSTQAPHVFNTNWILTDYTQENGCFAVRKFSLLSFHSRFTHKLYAADHSRQPPLAAPADGGVPGAAPRGRGHDPRRGPRRLLHHLPRQRLVRNTFICASVCWFLVRRGVLAGTAPSTRRPRSSG